MSKEKQIEEITKILDSNCEGIPDTVCQENSCSSCKARQIIGIGYRKQSENTVTFPCKVGDTVFMIDDLDCDPYVIGVKVEYLKTDKFGEWVGLRYPLGIKYSPQIPIEDIGKTLFLTEEEAEKALAERK